MSGALAGRALAAVGIVAGLLAVALDLISGGGSTSRYVDNGAVAAFLVVLLSFASYLPAEVGLDTGAAAAGTAAFGFYLFVPGLFAFNHLATLGAAGWLGVATALIPTGWAIVRVLEREPDTTSRPSSAAKPAVALRDPLLAPVAAGLSLITAGIWLPALSGSASYWNASFSGHAVGLLTLLAVALNLAALAAPFAAGIAIRQDVALLVAAGTFGLVEAELVLSVFNRLGSLGAGGWLEAAGGLLLIAGIVAMRIGSERRAPVTDALVAAQAA
jgi:hypothetical protein